MFCENEPSVSVKYCLIDGKIETYEMPLSSHSEVIGELIYMIRNWSDR